MAAKSSGTPKGRTPHKAAQQGVGAVHSGQESEAGAESGEGDCINMNDLRPARERLYGKSQFIPSQGNAEVGVSAGNDRYKPIGNGAGATGKWGTGSVSDAGRGAEIGELRPDGFFTRGDYDRGLQWATDIGNSGAALFVAAHGYAVGRGHGREKRKEQATSGCLARATISALIAFVAFVLGAAFAVYRS
jgi:hypothetical protein